jgi:hypothetical protein
MSLRWMLPALLFALVLSVAIAVMAVGRDSGEVLALATALFGAQVLLVLLRINVPLWRGADLASAGLGWARSNTLLAAVAYAWGAASMFAIYSLTGLYWRHGWQYGTGMALLGFGALFFGSYLTREGQSADTRKSLSILMGMAAAQAGAVGIALAYLLASGKLIAGRSDWAANHIFVAGCIIIGTISLVSLLTYRRLLAAPQLVA